ncbi:hypothetical protein BIY22_01015 [Vibrio panuliri]|uniref:Uncharacterized protein n=1 Tax=Vibrio panuliri TaxID=1381081 RepID=A0A1Q9HQF2_9VIBR|nr:magnetosome protein MamC [Vibrio panuliri]OLQ93104.1 hypothetical protein BIY22_01015 [Vibrio panuliri]
MSNSSDKLSAASRAMIIGAMAGGSASVVSNWQRHQQGELATNEMVAQASISAVKAGVVSGASTYVAEKMAGRPVLSLLTILSVGAAGVYLMDQLSEEPKNEQ